MKILIDTHTFLWYVWDDPKLSANAIAIIEDASHDLYVSIATIWELAIKVSTGKIELTRPFEDLLSELIYGNGFKLLPVEFAHLVEVSKLPFHHKDPFDRLMVAQSRTERMPFLSADVILDEYGISRLW